MGSLNIKEIELDKLAFDPDNPRLPSTFVWSQNDESPIVSWLVHNANLVELLESIASQGFFNGEPILGYKDGDKYVVVEGNRRLGAVKLFNHPDLSDYKKRKIEEVIKDAIVQPPTKIPFIEYEKREEILDYLGYRHITGIKSWGALAKAKYLSQMREKLLSEKPNLINDIQSQLKFLAKEIGTNGNYVGRLLTGLTLYKIIEENDFYGLSEVDEESLNFSLLTTALSYKNIASFLGLNDSKDLDAGDLNVKNLQRLVSWVYKKNEADVTRLEDSRNLSMLAKVVSNDKALTKFSSGDMKISEAVLLTDHPDEIVNKSLDAVFKNARIALEYSSHVDKPQSSLLDKLRESRQLLTSINTILEAKEVDQDLGAI